MKLRRHQSGQLVMEYVLILVITVTIATFITSQLVSRNAQNPGFMVAKWQLMLTTIGADHADGRNPN